TRTREAQTTCYLMEALILLGFGWSVIPVREKKATARWERWQRERSSELSLGKLFRKSPPPTGLAVILGEVSGWLTCRDFDSKVASSAWAKRHPPLADACPTVQTRRGFHVYYRDKDRDEPFIKWPDGELRGSCKQYVLLPPSEHPEGGAYK